MNGFILWYIGRVGGNACAHDRLFFFYFWCDVFSGRRCYCIFWRYMFITKYIGYYLQYALTDTFLKVGKCPVGETLLVA